MVVENANVDSAPTVAPPTAGAGEGQSAGGSVLAELEADAPQAPVEASPDPWGDPEFLKRLESLDFSKAPKPLRDKLEAPFERHWTKKFQENAETARQLQARQDQLVNVAIEKLRAGGVETPTQTVQDQIRERIEAGDMSAIPELMRQEIEREVGPMRQQAALRNAIETAGRMSPMVREKEPEIAAMLRDDPGLQQMAAENNYRNAPYVLAGLADRIELAQIKQQFEAFKASAEATKRAYAKQAIAELRAQGASLPSVTSQAGSSGTSNRGGEPMTGSEAIMDAFVKAGGVLDPRL